MRGCSCVEFMAVRCRPYHLLQEFRIIVIVAVYIPPDANAKEALWELYEAVRDLQSLHPEGFFIIAGDFNQANQGHQAQRKSVISLPGQEILSECGGTSKHLSTRRS